MPDTKPPRHKIALPDISLPTAAIPHPTCSRETWYSTAQMRTVQRKNMVFLYNEEVCFSYTSINVPSTGLAQMIEEAYLEIFAHMNKCGNHVPMRFWNWLPVGESPSQHQRLSMEHAYQVFCQGRLSAFQQLQVEANCAATVVGTTREKALVLGIASKWPAINIENPLQTPPHLYPNCKSSSKPLFARATFVEYSKTHGQLFVSATASIRGHTTMGSGEPAIQMEIILQNVQSLLQQCGTQHRLLSGLTLANLTALKVYIRNVQDSQAIAACVRSYFDLGKIQFLLAPLCRSNILVELEGMANVRSPEDTAFEPYPFWIDFQ